MSMFVKLKDRVINLAHVALVERDQSGKLTIHYSIPHASIVAMVQYDPKVSGPPAATDHFVESIPPGADADEIWKHIQGL